MRMSIQDMRMTRMTKCTAPQSNEVNAITTDFLEFCRLLKESGNDDVQVVSLSEFAKWRVEEGVAEEPIPSIN